LDRNTTPTAWQWRDIYNKLQERLAYIPTYRGKHVYAIWLRNAGTTNGLYADSFNLLILPAEYMLKQKNLSDITLTVAAGSTLESSEVELFSVVTGQMLGVSLEHKSSDTLFANSELTINVKLKNKDGTVNSTISYKPPVQPSTAWTKINFYVKIPAGASYATITATFTNNETGSITVYVRNLKVWPVPDAAAETRWGVPTEPAWIDGAETTAPSAGTALVSVTVGAGKTGRVFGIHITADEANSFQLAVGTTVIKRFSLPVAGTIHIVLNTPILDKVPENSTITIKNVSAGSAGKVYQASLLYHEG
jgi:hypothetical protein